MQCAGDDKKDRIDLLRKRTPGAGLRCLNWPAAHSARHCEVVENTLSLRNVEFSALEFVRPSKSRFLSEWQYSTVLYLAQEASKYCRMDRTWSANVSCLVLTPVPIQTFQLYVVSFDMAIMRMGLRSRKYL